MKTICEQTLNLTDRRISYVCGYYLTLTSAIECSIMDEMRSGIHRDLWATMRNGFVRQHLSEMPQIKRAIKQAVKSEIEP